MVKATSVVPSWCKVLHKGQSTDSLLKKLKDLQSHLSATKDRPSEVILDSLGEQLIKEDLLFHKDKEVRSSLACCLADLLRVCAPEPPFEQDQLQTIFTFFLNVLTKSSGGLSKPNGPLFSDACMLLENLASTKSILLMYELESADALISDYFCRTFDIIKLDLPKKVELTLASMLADLAKESDVPKKVIELLIGFFNSAVMKTNRNACQLATLIFNEASNELQMHVNQYISEAIVTATSKDETPEMEQALQKIHKLIININKSAPDVLVSILPQLEDGLRAENDTLREASVRTLGQMFAERASLSGGDGYLARKHVSTWRTWLGRCMDKSISIRLAWVEAIRGLVVHHAELWTELELCITQKLIDPDDKVRIAIIKIFGTLDYDTLRHRVSRKVLRLIGSRVLDKKQAVRSEALEVTGRAFSLAYPEIKEPSVKEHFGWIPNVVLSVMTQGITLAMVPVQRTFTEYIVPLPTLGQEDETKWTERYISVLEVLDDEHVSVLFKISNLLDPRHHLTSYLEACKKFNGGIVDGTHEHIAATKKALIRSIELIAKCFPDSLLAAKELNEFAKQNDPRAYKFLATIIDSRSDLKACVGAMTVIKKKIHSNSSGKTNETMAAFVRMAGYPLVGTSSVPCLLARLQSLRDIENDKMMRSRLYSLLKAMADQDAAIFSKHTELLVQTLQTDNSTGDVIAVCFLALAKLQMKTAMSDHVQLDQATIERAKYFVKSGSHLEAKMAAKLLAILASSQDATISQSARTIVEEFSNEVALNLAEYKSSQLTGSMAALKQFAKHANDTMLPLDDVLVQSVVQSVLTQSWTPENTCREDEKEVGEEEDWVEDEDMNDELRARVTAIQFLTQRCLSNADDSEVVDTMMKPVLRLLFACLMHGQPSTNLKGKASARARIRCVCAISLLKLARRGSCERNITSEEFQTFATTIQDETYQVRDRFLRKLLRYWVTRNPSLPPRYYALGFMTAFDPEEELKKSVQSTTISLLSVMTQELRLKYFDVGLARLLHLLNHYPDFANGGLSDLESLKNVAVYLDFYLECCANESNLACLYYIATRCKGHEDVAGPEASKGLYRLSELTMCLIKKRADALGCNIGNWSGRVNLPSELYKSLPSRANQNEIYKRSYLTDEEVDFFQQQAVRRPVTSAAKRKASTDGKESNGVKKRARVSTAKSKSTSNPKRKRKSTKKEEESEDESDLSDAIVSSDEGENLSEVDSEIQVDEEEVSEDEEVESSADEEEGRGARIKSRLRKEKIARNEVRAKRRQKQIAISAK